MKIQTEAIGATLLLHMSPVLEALTALTNKFGLPLAKQPVQGGSLMKRSRKLIGVAILISGMPAAAVQVFVQHQAQVTRNPLIASVSGPGFMASADAVAGEFKVYGIASNAIRNNGNRAGTERPYEFTNNPINGQITILPGTYAHVHADVFGSPPASLATGGNNSTTNDVQATLSVTILDGIGTRSFLAQALYQETTEYHPDGTLKDFDAYFRKFQETNGATVLLSGGSGISLNMSFQMPAMVLDPGARMQVSFLLEGTARDGSTVDAYNTARLSLVLPFGVTLENDSGQPLAWVSNAPAVPEPQTYALLLGGLGMVGAAAHRRRQRSARS